ncbi:MAG: CCA tRNA nucleotidyltransferase [Phycisphaerales bacterium]|jgi:tRNA nucleotidyltransferase/poly(A) polymerase|nr:CCA tRNA nucleotidyltransferase [Phycisphaerales bacterium]
MTASCPNEARSAAIEILTTLRTAGFETYFAGGCVRDRLLSAAPTEYDIATAARPEEIKTLFPKAKSVGEAFGVMLVRKNNIIFDVATFRSDGEYKDHRHPTNVTFTDAEHDAQRRDFTINGLFEDPIEERVIDYVGGKDDVDARIIRAIGDPHKRLDDDHLRMLRAVRFASNFSFSIESETADAIRQHAHRLDGISRERIGGELRQMLTHTNRGVAAWELQYLGLDVPVLGEQSILSAPTRVGRLPAISTFATALAAWIIDRHTSEADLQTIATRWREQLLLSNREYRELQEILTLHTVLGSWETLGVAKQKRLASAPQFPETLAILQAEDRPMFVFVKQAITELCKTGLSPEPFVTGDDLVKASVPQSPSIGLILDALYDAQLEGGVTCREDALELAKVIARDILGDAQ